MQLYPKVENDKEGNLVLINKSVVGGALRHVHFDETCRDCLTRYYDQSLFDRGTLDEAAHCCSKEQREFRLLGTFPGEWSNHCLGGDGSQGEEKARVYGTPEAPNWLNGSPPSCKDRSGNDKF